MPSPADPASNAPITQPLPMKIQTLLLSLVAGAGAAAITTSLKSPAEASFGNPSGVFQEKPADEEAKDSKKDEKAENITVWILDAEGKGWSAGKNARWAIDKTIGDDIDRIFMSGTRATFTLKDDAKVDEKAVEAMLKKRGLKLISLTSRETARAAAAYVAATPGLTWSDTAGKVREALMKELGDDVEDVFAGTEIIVHMKSKDAKLDTEKLMAILAKNKVKLKGDVKKDPKYIL